MDWWWWYSSFGFIVTNLHLLIIFSSFYLLLPLSTDVRWFRTLWWFDKADPSFLISTWGYNSMGASNDLLMSLSCINNVVVENIVWQWTNSVYRWTCGFDSSAGTLFGHLFCQLGSGIVWSLEIGSGWLNLCWKLRTISDAPLVYLT